MKKYLESPIFSVVCLDDGVLMSCGGGGKRFGLTNYLVCDLHYIYRFYSLNPLRVHSLRNSAHWTWVKKSMRI